MTANQVEQLMANIRDCSPPELIETHISWVVICDRFVYKIKKPVKYFFLDFSTLELRKIYCDQELYLNQRLTRGMYLEVVAIREKGDQLLISDGEGKIVDYAVKMLKMDQSLQMDHVLKGGGVSKDHVRRIAIKVAQFHLGAEIIHMQFDRQIIQQKFDDLVAEVDFLTQFLGPSAKEMITGAEVISDRFLDDHQGIFERRIRHGLVRDVHGDLYSKNIFLYEDPVIFDCIEFNDQYRLIDVLSEVAFFSMDMDAHGRQDLAEAFETEYFRNFPALECEEDRLLLLYLKSYRANVRAKVNALKARQAQNSVRLRKYLEKSKKYLVLMTQYLHQLTEAEAEITSLNH